MDRPGIDYSVDPHRADKFYAAVRKYWPDLKDGALQPGYAGIRPKIVPPGAPAQDFVDPGPGRARRPGLINLFGIELPGLTASLALAEQVRDIAGDCMTSPAAASATEPAVLLERLHIARLPRHADGPCVLPRQKLDLYRPTTPRADGKSVIFFYGGSWDSGSKDDYLFVGQALAARGITTIIADYRLYPEVRFPPSSRTAPGRALGCRPGGHRQALHHGPLRRRPDRLDAGGQHALPRQRRRRPPADARSHRHLRPLRFPATHLGEADRHLRRPNNPEIEPITFARAPLPPALLIHGTADTTVYPRNAEHLAAAWRAAARRRVEALS